LFLMYASRDALCNNTHNSMGKKVLFYSIVFSVSATFSPAYSEVEVQNIFLEYATTAVV